MKLRDFINTFSHNNIIRLHIEEGKDYKSAFDDENDVVMDWQIVRPIDAKGRKYSEFADCEVIKLVSILYETSNYPEAINIVVESPTKAKLREFIK